MTFSPSASSRLGFAAILAFAAHQASAQSMSLEAAGDVIVTATKTEQSVQDLPFSVSVLGGEGLERLDSAEEITQSLTGVQAAVANGTQIAFQIRGIGAVDHQALTPTAAAVYVDGVFQATNVQTGPLLFDMERVEVLKGPQGSLYGRNATAGAINFISKRPSDKTEGYISAELGNFERLNVNAAINVPASEDLSLRLSGRYLTQGPLIENVDGPEAAGGERNEFGVKALGFWTPSDNTDVLINLHYAEDNGVNPAPLNSGLDLGEHEISVGSDGVQDTDNEFYGASVEVNHDFGAFDVTSLTAFEGYNQQYGFDFGGRAFGSSTANLAYDRDFEQISQELRVHREGEKYDSLIGLYLEQEDFEQDYLIWCGELDRSTLQGSCSYFTANKRVGAAPRPFLADGVTEASALSLQSVISQERSTAALFTHNTYNLTPKLDLIWGARYTFEDIEAKGEGRHIFNDAAATVGLNNQYENDGTILVGPAIGSNEISDEHFSGNLGLSYSLSDTVNLYASYANGYKSGGFNGEVINNASHFDDTGLFEAETVDMIELGAKLSGSTYRVNLAAFYNDYDEPQARFFENVTLESGQDVARNSLSNFESATSHGLEVDARLFPAENVNIFAAATLQDSEIEDSTRDYLDGDELPFASDVSLVLGGDYTTAISDTLAARFALSAKYQSEFTTGADTEGTQAFVQDGYSTVDGAVTLLGDSGAEFGLWARNLGDVEYSVSAYNFGVPVYFLGAPRTYGFSLKYNH